MTFEGLTFMDGLRCLARAEQAICPSFSFCVRMVRKTTSDDQEFIERVRDARLLGVKGDSMARNAERRLYEFEVEDQGWRYHMSNMNAAIGKAQFAAFPERAALRQELAQTY